MKLAKNHRIRLIGILVISLMRFAFMSSDELSGENSFGLGSLLQDGLLALFISAMIWETSRLTVLLYNRKYPLKQLSSKRFGAEVAWVIVAQSIAFGFTIVIFVLFFNESQPPNPIFWAFGFLDRYIYGILVAALYELLLFMEAWKKAVQEAEELKGINLAVQLDSLKNQVRPHFLFNNLNTLTALVEKDSRQAVQFIAELSNVYRFLLQGKEKELIPLQQELQFIRSYFYLIQARFREAVELKIEVGERYQQHLIAPLSLQTLMEHALSHNQVSVRHPLRLQIKVEEDDCLVVVHNIQPKRQEGTTDGNSLQHIINKYKLLNLPEVEMAEEGGSFYMKIPLIVATPV